MGIPHPAAAPTSIVVLTHGLGRLLRVLPRRFSAQHGRDVLTLITERDTVVEPRFHADLFAAHPYLHARFCDLVSLSAKLPRVIVSDRALLDVAQDRRQVVLGAQLCASVVLAGVTVKR
jgi:hypothetical protein